ncbi:MAG: hypothetical protein EOO73_11455 [Myxococcales bacterium]|nr:MAG: hypothetical protein EOO73_11455 [Myxococcales bacterium]
MIMNIDRWALFGLTFMLSCRERPAPEPEAERKDAGARATPAVAADAHAALDRMDPRTPLPLLPMMAHHQKQNMRDHLAAVQQIVAAVATQEFATVEKAAASLGFSESMGRMCAHMGSGAPGFTDAALQFHHGADELVEAARRRDTPAILTSLGQTLSRCTGCHEQYKQAVVDEREWEAITHETAREPP